MVSFSSCKEKTPSEAGRIIAEWKGREIKFPSDAVFTIDGVDTIDYRFNNARYKIVAFADSSGCTSCDLKLSAWIELYRKLESSNLGDIPIVLYVHPKDPKEILYNLSEVGYHHPICIDVNNSFNKLNHLPEQSTYQSFLLDKDNKILLIGNPIHNPKLKELFISEMTGEDSHSGVPQTAASFEKPELDLGVLNIGESRDFAISLKNTGNELMVIHDVSASCGCVSVDYSKEPARPGEAVELRIHYQADKPGVVRKTITVYGNTQPSLLHFSLKAEVVGNK